MSNLKKIFSISNLYNIKNWKGWRNRTVEFLTIIGIFLNILLWLFLAFKVKSVSTMVPLKYNVLLGVTEIGKWYQVYRLPSIGLMIFFLNLILAGILYKDERLASYLLLGFSVFIQLLILIVEIVLVILITR